MQWTSQSRSLAPDEIHQQRQPDSIPVNITPPFASHAILPLPGECGLQSTDRIVNGEEAGLKELPWMALIKYNTRM